MSTLKNRDASFRELVAEELKRCSKCGSCASICPIYAEKKTEAYCSRGKLKLAQASLAHPGKLSDKTAAIFNDCLFCLACRENCPGGVRMDKVLLAARELLVEQGKQSKVKHAIFSHLLAKPARLNGVMRACGTLQPLLFQSIPKNSGLRRRFPLPLLAEDQPVPRIAVRPLLDRCQESIQAKRVRGTVLYFAGCGANYLYPTIGESVIYILHELGYDVIIPKGQCCCGTPVEVSGDTGTLPDLIRTNIDVLGAYGYPIITSCGSCGLMLRKNYPELAPLGQKSKAAAIAGRTFDIAEFLEQDLGGSDISAHLSRACPGVVTYHDPCHLVRGLGIKAQPRNLIKRTGCIFKELREADRCCGSGGTYGVTHWEISRGILDRKIRNIVSSEASVVATGCPACILQIESGLARNKLGCTVLHTVELLAWHMGYTPAYAHEKIRFDHLKTKTNIPPLIY
ncbi:MAG: (Fe-S)-binding protein [Mailhella sp.]|nr:(Fe-S)-binding protein [Mailhella sp.]